jgi:Beta-ketoacyl synthase, N-terminal domain
MVRGGFSFAIPVARWASWPGPECMASPSAPDVRFIDASLRRRLGPLAKSMIQVAHACAHDVPQARLVFASRHGELDYTVSLLRALAGDEPLSPTTFSLAVHNAGAGVLSIQRRDDSEHTALAAGDETLGHALLESCAQLAEAPHRPVLMVYGDAPLPEEYGQFAESQEADAGCAVAVLLQQEASRHTTVSVDPCSGSPTAERQAASFIRHLDQGRAGGWSNARHSWSWH